MRRCHYTITRQAVHGYAEQLCQRHIRFKDHGPKCKAGVLWAVLFWAASRISSLAAACASLREAPSDSAAHNALLATLPAYAELQRRLNRGLTADLPKGLRKRRQPMAFDLTLVPYHGQPLHEADEVYRGQAKCGTTHFHAYATAYVIRKGQLRSSRPTGFGSGSRRATARCTRVGSGRRRGGRRCGSCMWGSRWCPGTSGCGCITRSCPCLAAADGRSYWSGCDGRRYCSGYSMGSRRRPGNATSTRTPRSPSSGYSMGSRRRPGWPMSRTPREM